MKRIIRLHCVVTLLLVSIVTGTTAAGAQTGSGYDLTWHSVDNGGAMYSTGGSAPNNYDLGSTIGQPDAGAMSGGSGADAYTLSGGFWAPPVFRALLPIVRKR